MATSQREDNSQVTLSEDNSTLPFEVPATTSSSSGDYPLIILVDRQTEGAENDARVSAVEQATTVTSCSSVTRYVLSNFMYG